MEQETKISEWSDESRRIALDAIKEEKLTTKEKVTILRELFPLNTVTSIAKLLNVHRRTVHRCLKITI